MKNLRLLLTTLFLAFSLLLSAKADKFYIVELKTNKGLVVLKLYNETPLHRDNFVKLCKEGFYKGILFHRVIDGFVIQAGDPESKSHKKGISLGEGELPYKIDSEILPQFFHKRGVLAAAREGDSVNPQRRSSSTHFYIAVGKVQSDADLVKAAERINKANKSTTFNFSPQAIEAYKSVGGIPHLDTQYTIFGEVVKGLDVVTDISKVDTDKTDRPLEDIWIISAKVRHVKKYR